MYDLRGIYFDMIFNVGISFVIWALILIADKFWKKSEKRKNKTKILVISLIMIFLIFLMWEDICAIKNPEILIKEGYFCDTYKEGSVFSRSYWFADKDEQEEGFELDSFSKDKIYPDEFQKDKRYRIYYESSTEIIVKVEEIN